jgi:hypothetical protein
VGVRRKGVEKVLLKALRVDLRGSVGVGEGAPNFFIY